MIGLLSSVVALLVIAGLALMMRDVYRQQAKRDAERIRSIGRVMVTLSLSMGPFVTGMQRMVKAACEMEQAMAEVQAAMRTKP